ncbi:MauE/DoxX family redox-associated membrane protein [Inquilinus sp. Marseille-Q2685]|uniref:MauE/DoxX family redox-associated membrane protein n=1 Tax=Inquilinus sp. Marseille-Q2685 TaxID=2866581 RepID=UPI001CE41C10|nr:MauE/DoxX family redox-associated membrane protein [Inquilinus sp. Marseille-Q2685]
MDAALLAPATAIAFIALLFARAAIHKVFDFTAFTGFVADYRLVPEAMARPLAAVVAAAEVAVVLALIVPGGQAAGAGLAAALLLAYAAGMAVNLRRGRDRIECGCGGTPQPLGWPLAGRNLVLAAIAGAAAAVPLSVPGLAGTLVVTLGGLTVFAAYLLAEQILANAALIGARR